DGEERYSCQATELLGASEPLQWWDPRQYARELRSGNVTLGVFLQTVLIATYNWLTLPFRRFGIRRYPHVEGRLRRTPDSALNLRAGERVRVKPKSEILATLDGDLSNRGLRFDVEMTPYCGREFTVLRRVERIVDDKTGKMLDLRNCIILDGACCGGLLSRDRLFCPRSLYPFWREIWLERVEDAKSDALAAGVEASRPL